VMLSGADAECRCTQWPRRGAVYEQNAHAIQVLAARRDIEHADAAATLRGRRRDGRCSRPRRAGRVHVGTRHRASEFHVHGRQIDRLQRRAECYRCPAAHDGELERRIVRQSVHDGLERRCRERNARVAIVSCEALHRTMRVDRADVRVELVWNPPWTMDMMSEEAKLELGFF